MHEISILVADDCEADRAVIERALRRAGPRFHLRFAESLREARSLLAEERFSLSILDYELGDGTAMEILEENPKTPVVVVSGHGSEELAVEVLKAGAFDYVRKDVDELHQNGIVRAVESTLARAEAAQARDARERELEEFAYVVTHDLKSALRRVSAHGALLADAALCDDEPGVEKSADALQNSIRALAFLFDGISRFTDASRGVREQFAEVDIAEVVKSVLADLDADAVGVDVELDPHTLPSVFGERTRLWQLFRNVIGNAIKFRRPRGGRVAITCSGDEGVCQFAVADNGLGIPESAAKDVFVLFRRGHEARRLEGSGIGLAIAKRVVELHGGEMWFESQEGQGSTFYFTLPRASAKEDSHF